MSLINKNLSFLVLPIFCFLISCKKLGQKELDRAIELSKENKSELIKTLNHYKSSEDKLKLKAAKFLIANMPYHGTKTNLEVYKTAFDTLSKYQYQVAWGSLDIGLRGFNKEVKRLNNIYANNMRPQYDLENLSSEFLIENIESAFNSWKSIPSNYRLNFDDFCEYILPYRNRNEEVFQKDRNFIKKKYNWVSKKLKDEKTPIEEVITQIIDSLKIDKSLTVFPKNFPVTMNFNQIQAVRRGDCTNLTTYAIHVLRAIGIGCSEDYTPHWGDDSSMGHSWLAIHLRDKTLIKDVQSNIFVDSLYNEAPISKIYRKTFKLNFENTLVLGVHNRSFNKQYMKTFDVTIDLDRTIKGPLYLCVFDSRLDWAKVDIIEPHFFSKKIN